MGEDNTLARNKVNGNGDDGIEVDEPSTGTKVKRNKAKGNFDWGIDAGAGPVSGGATNKTAANGRPDQCRWVGICV